MNRRKINRNRLERHHVTPRCLLKHKDKDFVNHKDNLSDRPITHHEHCKAHQHLFMLLGDSCGPGVPQAYYSMVRGHFYCDTTGRKASVEERKKQSERTKGRKVKPEHVRKQVESRRTGAGFAHTEETKRKISISATGRKFKPEHVRKQVESRRTGAGFAHTEESKRKIGIANKGKKRTEESRKRISEARKKMGKKWSCNGIICTIAQATEIFGMTHTGIIKRCNSPKYPEFFIVEDQTLYNGIEYPIGEIKEYKVINGHCKECSIDGVIFNSATEAARTLNIPLNTVSKRLRNPNKPDYFYCS